MPIDPHSTPIYLDHASTSWPKSPGVGGAMLRTLAVPGSPRRGVSAGSAEAQAIDDQLRAALARVLNTTDPRRIVMTGGATESLNIAIAGVVLAARLAGRDRPRIVTTQIEHNAVRRPLLALAARGQIDLRVVEVGADTRASPLRILMEATGGAGDAPAEMVVMTWASNVSGAIQPIEEVAAALRNTPTLLLVDASQSVGLIRPERGLDALGIDLAAFSGHKALGGPAGVGGLYVGPKAHPLTLAPRGPAREHDARIAPILLGGTGGESESEDMPDALPHRFEPGTPATPARAGWLAALQDCPLPHQARAHAGAMVDRLLDRLGWDGRGPLVGLDRLRAHALHDPANRLGVVSLTIDALTPAEAAVVLESEFGIIVRAGLHCAPGAHEAMGTLDAGGTIRVSVGHTTTPQEIDALGDALRSLVQT